MKRAALRCSALVVVALAALPSACLAGPLDIPAAVPAQFRALVRERLHMPKPHAASEYRFDLKTRQGYAVSVIAEEDIVALEVIRSDGQGSAQGGSPLRAGAVTVYVARGTVAPNRIAASFGAIGKVDVRFRPSGQVAKSRPRRHCRGADRFTSRLGVFVGRIQLSGEDRYFSVHAHRAKGRIRSPLRLNCATFASRPAPMRHRARPVRSLSSSPPTLLSATQRHGISAVELLALQIRKRTLFLAVTEQSHGSMAEVRYAVSVAKARAFTFNDARTSAMLEPPKPFRGRGTYRAAPDGTTSWSGSLSVSFPGAPRLPLAGPEFKTSLSSGF